MSNDSPEKRRILLIDDNESIHNDIKEILIGDQIRAPHLLEMEAALFGTPAYSSEKTEFSFDVDSAFQGQDGLEMVRQALWEENPYALAFVDMRMPPGWDGVETIQRIWQEYPDIQIVICTAYSEFKWKDILHKLGRTDQLLILKKPFENIEVYQLACALTEKWHLAREVRVKQ